MSLLAAGQPQDACLIETGACARMRLGLAWGPCSSAVLVGMYVCGGRLAHMHVSRTAGTLNGLSVEGLFADTSQHVFPHALHYDTQTQHW